MHIDFFQQKTDIQCITIQNVKVHIKRDDQNDPVVQGNKLRKLKYNVIQALDSNSSHLLTFGGAHSNHIIATAYCAHKMGLKSIGIIRGDELINKEPLWSQTLVQAKKYGMELFFLSRDEYRQKNHSKSFKKIHQQFDKPYVLPEGGSNELAVSGVSEMIGELAHQLDSEPSHIFCACGTGGTLAGIIKGVAAQAWDSHINGVPVLKGLKSLRSDVKAWLGDSEKKISWSLLEQYHFGGYAKSTIELRNFCLRFDDTHNIKLDRVYNSKSFFALSDQINKGLITRNDKPLIIHTGGLQGGVFK